MQCNYKRRTIKGGLLRRQKILITEQYLWLPSGSDLIVLKSLKIIFMSFKNIIKKIQILIMMYPIYMQNINVEYFVFWASQKWLKCRCGYAYFQISIFLIKCYFYVAHNTKNFGLRFCMLVDYIVKLCLDLFSECLKLINVISEKKKTIKSAVPGGQKSSLH
jgi:hypothetical protein